LVLHFALDCIFHTNIPTQIDRLDKQTILTIGINSKAN
jgi:hypothetical protein